MTEQLRKKISDILDTLEQDKLDSVVGCHWLAVDELLSLTQSIQAIPVNEQKAVQENSYTAKAGYKPQDNIELKREWEFWLKNHDTILHGISSNIVPEIWNFFIPHLKDDNKIRREAFKEGWLAHYKDMRTAINNIEKAKNILEEYLKKEGK